jgi:histidyl-tRNA synthetase
MHAGGGNYKSQFKKADASGARFALVFGADELARGEVAVKSLRDAATPQVARAITDVTAWAHELRNA